MIEYESFRPSSAFAKHDLATDAIHEEPVYKAASDQIKQKCFRIIVSGRVQGVFYRQFVRKYAIQNSLTGQVRNMPDGRVEILIRISESVIPELTKYLRRGPPDARVINLSTKEVSAFDCPLRGFEIR